MLKLGLGHFYNAVSATPFQRWDISAMVVTDVI